MHQATFTELLRECDTNKHAFARELKVSPSTVYRWGDDAPPYAMIILRTRAGVRRCLAAAQEAGQVHIEKLRGVIS